MNTKSNNQKDAIEALKKAMEIRHIWMQALSGKISKEELDAKGVRFMAVTE
jgi:amino acid permease